MNEIILHVAAEGGGLTLYGIRRGTGWLFSRHVLDWTPELLDEPWIEHTSEVARTWPEALALLDRYPWHMLRPTKVHAAFHQLVFDAAAERYSSASSEGTREDLAEWKRKCNGAI